MKNQWLDEKIKKKLGKELEDALMELWADDATFGMFYDEASDELAEFLDEHTVHAVDTEDDKVIITLKRP
jgi:hypothetical protein